MIQRLPLIRCFHIWFLHGLQRSPPQTCPKYGRFAASVMFHMDQIPLPFVHDSSRSLNAIGRPCYIFQPKGDLDKRQASIQLCIRAEGEQLVRVGIIFRGRGRNPKAGELKVYAMLKPFICVYFQPKAWCDGFVALEWLDQFQADTAHLGERVLGMDGLATSDPRMQKSYGCAQHCPRLHAGRLYRRRCPM